MDLKILQILNLKQYLYITKHSENCFHATFWSMDLRIMKNEDYLKGKEEEENLAYKKLLKSSNPIQKHS